MAEIHIHGGKAVILTIQNEISKIKIVDWQGQDIYKDCFSEWKDKFTKS